MESVWLDIHKRSTNDTDRQEDMVKTCLGNFVPLNNKECNVDGLITDLFRKGDNMALGICKVKDMNFSLDELANVRKFEAPYNYLIYDGGHGMDLVVNFPTYKDLNDDCHHYYDCSAEEQGYCEKDYISVCKCVATKLKEVGQYLEWCPYNKTYVINHSDKDYDGDYALKLIDEGDVYSWTCEHGEDYENPPFGNTYLEDFKEGMINEFKELDDTPFLYWTYRDGSNIALPLTVDNVVNFKKYYEFTQNWFKV